MAELIPAVCPQCGGELQVPQHLEKAHCMYCGTQFIIDKKVDKHIHYHVREAAFKCEICGRAKTLEEYSGVDGRSLCKDCYYDARNKGWGIWGIGMLLFILGIVPMISGEERFIPIGFALIIIGFVLALVGKIMIRGR